MAGRPMRRKDREIRNRAAIDTILAEAQVCRLGVADDEGPYVVPVCFGYDPKNSALYIHSAPEGRKIAALIRNPRCCFEADLCDGLIRGDRACTWGMRYRSVIGYGRAQILRDPDEKREGLSCIMSHYGSPDHSFSDSDLDAVTVIRIAIECMTGKQHE